MRCKYCHNPETWAENGGDWKAELWDVKELFDKVYRYKNYWGKNLDKGGITVSGGEPLLQMEFVTEFFKLAKAKGVHTALDTSGQPFKSDAAYLEKLDELLKYTDLVMLDMKAFDDKLHKELTGCGNSSILEFAQHVSASGTAMWIRRVLVPGVTDSEEDLTKTAEFIKTLAAVEKVEVLPYHTLGLFKWQKLNLDYPLEGVRTPSREEVERAESILGIK